MKAIQIISCISFILILSSCAVNKGSVDSYSYPSSRQEEPIIESLFNDKNSTISEENIQKILGGKLALPNDLKVALVNLDLKKSRPQYRYRYYDDNNPSTNEKYIGLISTSLEQHKRIKQIVWVPSMMIGSSPNFTTIREAAVRMQADIVIVFSISEGNIYVKDKMFSSEYKGNATTQAMVMDVRTGLIPFTDISSESYTIPKEDKDKNKAFNEEVKRKHILEQAALITLKNICSNITNFLN